MITKYKEVFYKWFVYKLPKELVYYCTIRLMAYGTTGKYSNTNVGNVRAITLLKRWCDKE